MTNKTETIFETWDEINLKDSKKTNSVSNFFMYLAKEKTPENFDIEKTTEELNNPIGLSSIYMVMLTRPDSGGDLYRGLIKNINKDFYEKLLAIHNIIKFNKHDACKKIEKERKTNFEPFQTETKNNIKTINRSLYAHDIAIESTKKDTEHTDEKIENNLRKNIYTDFIAILGIFTAITFAIFGGMNLLSNLFQNIGSTPASLGQTLILAAIFGLFMWGIIELLFNWISKIKEPLNQSENGKKEDNKKEKCLCPKVCRISFIKPVCIALIVLVAMLVIGIKLFIQQ